MTHKLIKTENYLLVVDDSEIKEGDWYLTFTNNEVMGKPRKCEDTNRNFTHCKKIIAHLPLNNSPILEGVPLLPPLEDEVKKLAKEEILYNDQKRAWWKQGYNKAKEKYKYTEEDLRIAIQQAFLSGVERLEDFGKVESMIIGNIQQPKMPVEFESEDEVYMYSINGDTMKPRTTTNSQGQTVLVGTYK